MTSAISAARNAQERNASVAALTDRVLRCLRRNGEPMSASQIGRNIKVGRAYISPILVDLYRQEILDAKEVKGGKVFYSFRRPEDQAFLLHKFWKGYNLDDIPES